MTDEELRAAKALCDAATPGPWTADLDMFADYEIEAIVSNADTSILFTSGTDFTGHHRNDGNWTEEDSRIRDATWRNARQLSKELRDAAFISASRTLVPQLIAEVERLRTELANRIAQRDEALAMVDRMLPVYEAGLAMERASAAYARACDKDGARSGIARARLPRKTETATAFFAAVRTVLAAEAKEIKP